MTSPHLSFRSLSILLALAAPACGIFGGSDKQDDGSDDGGFTFGDGTGDGGGNSGVDEDGDGYDDDVDCDDSDASIHPGAEEICDGVDQDCDDVIDENPSDGSAYYADADGDGHGDPDSTVTACEEGDGAVSSSDDCDDGDADVYPGNDEYCDDKDNNCDGQVDEGAEGTWFKDADGDGYGEPSVPVEGCRPGSDYVSNDDDCDDTDDNTYPGADEVCDSADNDCDLEVDEDPVDGDPYYEDIDGDGLGSGTVVYACDGITNSWDCNDADGTEPMVVDAAAGSSGNGTLAKPYKKIQDGINHASECVIVFAGTYAEAIDFKGTNMTVTGVEGATDTTIDATGKGSPAVTFDSGEGSTAVLQGFTITGGDGWEEATSSSTTCNSNETCTDYYTTYCGGGILASGSDPTLIDLVVQDNILEVAGTTTSGNDTYTVYSFGGGACFLSSAATMEGVDFLGNFADQGGAIYVDQYSTIDMGQGSLFENTATDGGAVQVDAGSLAMSNVISAWNVAGDDGGGALVAGGSLAATNVTWGYETGGTGGGIYVMGSGSSTTLNSIIYSAAGTGIQVESGSSFSGKYNDVYGNTTNYSGITDPTGSNGNISSNPKFTDVTNDGNAANDDWTLTSSSPAVNAGNPTSTYNDADGTANDMGAYGGPDGVW